MARIGSRRLRAAVSALALTTATCQPVAPTPSGSITASPIPTQGGAAATAPTCRAAEPVATRPAWRDRVFYEVFVRSFADSDGDGIGDLAGLSDRLDYLNDGDPATTDDLGITGIWLMPVSEAASYHGYDVTDYTAIERAYGTLAEMRAFVEAAHTRGIAVIVDLVINHTSRDHPWFLDALEGGPHRDWYIWSESDPGWPPVAGPSPWHPTAAGDWYYGAFWEGMPDLNLENPDVTAEIERVAGFWLDEVGIDGFRLDAAKHLIETSADSQEDTPETHRWLERFVAEVHAQKPDSFVVAEVFDLTSVSSSYAGSAADTTFDFELAGKMLLGIQAEDGPTIAAAVAETFRSYPEGAYAGFLTNHDQPRVTTQLSRPGAERAAASLLLTGPGAPFVFYGEELGLPGGKPDERIRSPMPWTSDPHGAGFTSGSPWEELEPGWETRNVATETTSSGSLLAHYRALIALRSDQLALRGATILPVRSSSPAVYAFLASSGADTVGVFVNLGSNEVVDVGFSVEQGPCDLRSPTVLYVDGLAETVIQEPVITTAGGFEAWRPVPVFPPYSTLVLDLDGVSP
jgi:alpha-amylase